MTSQPHDARPVAHHYGTHLVAGDDPLTGTEGYATQADHTTLSTTVSTLQVTAFGRIIVTVFTGDGTYTPHAAMLYCRVRAVGGGGGGGAVTATISAAGGGGAGGYAEGTFTRAQIGASKAVTMGTAGSAGSSGGNGGNGGDTSLGTLLIAKGGLGGIGDGGTLPPATHHGGLGGVAGTGDLTSAGQAGGMGFSDGVSAMSGAGGSSQFGGGGAQEDSGVGAAGAGYGGGGGGGSTLSATHRAGGAGALGVMIVEEYLYP